MAIKERLWREVKKKGRRTKMSWYNPLTWRKRTSGTTEVLTSPSIPTRITLEVDVTEVRRRASQDPAAFKSWGDRMAEEAIDIEPVLAILRVDLASLQEEKSDLEGKRTDDQEKVRVAREAIKEAFDALKPMSLEDVRHLETGIEVIGQDVKHAATRLKKIETLIQNINVSLQ